ncbi:hypothetical protein K9L63_02675 [Candidatus Gracilibacteria bacterium]|nr:hypothetical protein [Candidatus Gracilibacteria bacterium]
MQDHFSRISYESYWFYPPTQKTPSVSSGMNAFAIIIKADRKKICYGGFRGTKADKPAVVRHMANGGWVK